MVWWWTLVQWWMSRCSLVSSLFFLVIPCLFLVLFAFPCLSLFNRDTHFHSSALSLIASVEPHAYRYAYIACYTPLALPADPFPPTPLARSFCCYPPGWPPNWIQHPRRDSSSARPVSESGEVSASCAIRICTWYNECERHTWYTSAPCVLISSVLEGKCSGKFSPSEALHDSPRLSKTLRAVPRLLPPFSVSVARSFCRLMIQLTSD